MARMSPLKWRRMSDLCDRLLADGSGMQPSDLQAAKELAAQVWSGWGQSKVVEDSNKQVREQEGFGSMNKNLFRANVWNSQWAKKVIEVHKRAEVDPDLVGAPQGEAIVVTKDLHLCRARGVSGWA
eukprot:7245392-Lingulodinium_polyedra.AAC.1